MSYSEGPLESILSKVNLCEALYCDTSTRVNETEWESDGMLGVLDGEKAHVGTMWRDAGASWMEVFIMDRSRAVEAFNGRAG